MKYLALIAASLLVVAGCEDKSTPTPAKPGTVQPPKGLTDMASTAKDKVVAGYQTAVDEAKAQIDTLSAKVKDASPDKKPEMQSALDKAQAEWDTAKKKLSDLKSSSASEWQKVSGEMQSSVDSLKQKLSDAMAKFK